MDDAWPGNSGVHEIGARAQAFLEPSIRPADLARKAGVSPQYVYAVLHGKRPASERIVKAAAELGRPVNVIGMSAKKTTPAREEVNSKADAT